MYTVIFMNGRRPEKLGTFGDKGQCRRAWRTCTQGAAIVDESGAVLEHRSGTTKEAERALGLLAAEIRAKLAKGQPVEEAAPPPEPQRAPAKSVPVEDDEEDDEEAAPTGPEDFRGEDYPSDGPQPIVPERGVTAPAPRPLEVTHAVAPATGAVVVGNDTERLTAPAAPVTCATKGCACTPAMVRSNTQLVLAPFCAACRVVIRQRGRTFPGGELAVMEHLRAGTLPPPSAQHAALGARGGKASVAVARAAARAARKPAPKPAPKPRREPSPAKTLAAGLETARACAEVVTRLGGLTAARELAALVEEHGGAAAVREALVAVAELGQVAA